MSFMPLLILLSLVVGATLGVLLINRGVSLKLLMAFLLAAVFLGFYLLSSGYDPQVLDARGVTELTLSGWVGLCTVLFTLSMGTFAFVAATVAQWPKPEKRRRRR